MLSKNQALFLEIFSFLKYEPECKNRAIKKIAATALNRPCAPRAKRRRKYKEQTMDAEAAAAVAKRAASGLLPGFCLLRRRKEAILKFSNAQEKRMFISNR